MAANDVTLREDGIIEIKVVGMQNAASVELMGRKTGVLITKLRAQGKPALVLDNLQQMGDVDSAGRNMVVELGKKLDFDRVAMVGKGGLVRIGANLILHATGRAEKVKYFDSIEEAMQWLTSPLSSPGS